MSSLTALSQHEVAYFIQIAVQSQQDGFPYQRLMDKYVVPPTMRCCKYLFSGFIVLRALSEAHS